MQDGKSRTQVHAMWSSDPSLSPASWNSTKLLQLPQAGIPPKPPTPPYLPPWWTAFNTSPTKGVYKGKEAYFLAIELGSPSALIGRRFTSVFAICTRCAETGDLSSGWSVLDPQTHIYRKDRYSACPTLRYYVHRQTGIGYFYLITLYEGVPNPKGAMCNSNSNKWRDCLAEVHGWMLVFGHVFVCVCMRRCLCLSMCLCAHVYA